MSRRRPTCFLPGNLAHVSCKSQMASFISWRRHVLGTSVGSLLRVQQTQVECINNVRSSWTSRFARKGGLSQLAIIKGTILAYFAIWANQPLSFVRPLFEKPYYPRVPNIDSVVAPPAQVCSAFRSCFESQVSHCSHLPSSIIFVSLNCYHIRAGYFQHPPEMSCCVPLFCAKPATERT